jgi:hypothetical protein
MKLSGIFIIFFLVVAQFSNAGDDKLAHLRSSKKIITVNAITAPYYTIQIVALKMPPGNPGFFKNVELAKEYICTDGYVRYTVGEYATFKLAAQELDRIKALGYADAFVLNLRKISLDGTAHSAPVQSSKGEFVPKPGVDYTVQLAAMRFPVYVSDFEEFENVQEYYMKDKIYRYCVGTYQGQTALDELERIRNMGYKGAFLVEVNDYLPFKIE